MKYIKAIFKHYIRLIIGFVLGLGVALAYLGINNGWSYLSFYSDGFFIAAGLNLAIGVLAIVGNLGMFNMFSFLAGRKVKANGFKEDYYEYSERKKAENAKDRTFFMPYIFVGLLFIIVSFIILIFVK